MNIASMCRLCERSANNNAYICDLCLSKSPDDLTSKRKQTFNRLLQSIGPIAIAGFDQLQLFCSSATNLVSKIQFNFIPEPKFSTRARHRIDEIAQTYLRQSNDISLQHLIPLETNGDGNCLYHSIIRLMPGMKADVNELRVRSMIMLVNNHNKYTERYPLLANEVGQNIEEYCRAVQDGAFSQLWDILALCDVLQCRIRSVWTINSSPPYVNEIYGPLSTSSSDVKHEITIMWTCASAEEDLRKVNQQPFPNHFVPLLPQYDSSTLGLDPPSENTQLLSPKRHQEKEIITLEDAANELQQTTETTQELNEHPQQEQKVTDHVSIEFICFCPLSDADLEPVQINDIQYFLNSDNVAIYDALDQSCFDTEEKELFSNLFKLLHGFRDTSNDTLDESFNRIVDEPLTPEKLIEIINNNQRLTPYVIDSLKRCHALKDIHAIFSECVDLAGDLDDKNIAEQFEDLIDKATTHIILTITIESMSDESQRFLANFIKRNDLPIPFTYYVWDQTENSLSYKINFNCLIEPLCLTNNRLYLQFGSDQCVDIGKTSLLPFIFNDKRKESLFTGGEKKYRNSCIDILFGNTNKYPYTIFDVHGTVDGRNLSLIKAIQVYTALQIVYVTENDLPDSSTNSNNDFLNTVMNYTSYSSSVPTIVIIFNPNFDKEEKTQHLINRFKSYYLSKQWSNIYWLSSPLLTTMKSLTQFKKTRCTERLKKQFSQLLEEIESNIPVEHLSFRSCFSIQKFYLDLKTQSLDGTFTEVKRKHVKFDIENKLDRLFKLITDQTENLKKIAPTSYYRSEIDTLKKQKLFDILNDSTTVDKLDRSLKQIELEKKFESGLTDYSRFMIDLLNNRTYIDLLITDIYLEKWRLKYVPKIKEEKERIKIKTSLHGKTLHKQQELIEKERESASTSNKTLDQILLKDLQNLREEDERLKRQLLEINAKLANVDLTVGLLCDELFALYDYFHEEAPVTLEKYHEDFIKIAQNIAKLVYKGFAIHMLRSRPLICSSRLMHMAMKYLHVNQENRLALLTVVGEQSSAKSSLLNATFGCSFRVSAGRCTVGMYLGVVQHKNLTLIILDTEGLMSLEESGSIFDNQMVTMAILTSHLVLINHKGDLSSTLEGLIGMSLYAKLRIQSLPFKPKLLFILRDQMIHDSNTNTFYEQLCLFKDNLQRSSSFLKVSVDEELEIKQENIVLLPPAFNKDTNEDLNITQCWRNQTFAYEINQLRKNIFNYFHKQYGTEKFGFGNIDTLYNKISSTWKTIDELGQSLLECKSLAELNVTNELKSIAKEIIQKTSTILLTNGTKLLNNLLIEQKQRTKEVLDDNTNNVQLSTDIYMKKFVENGFHQLDDLTYKLIKDATNEYEQCTQQTYYATLKSNIQRNIEPSIRCTQQLLKQRFDQDVYTISKENAALQVQKQLLNSAKMYFDKQTQNRTDINELNAVLDKRHKELYREFENNLNFLKKSQEDITKTILTIYNGLVKTRETTSNKYDIYNLCSILDPSTYHEECQKLDLVFKSIQSYLVERQQSNKNGKPWRQFFTISPWKKFREDRYWFIDHHNDDHNKQIFLRIAEDVIPQLSYNVNTMLSTIKLSYNDPALITNLIQYVNNLIISPTSPIQQNWNYLIIPSITRDLILIALRFLIEQAKQIADRKHEELRKALDELAKWKTGIQEQFASIENSFKQGEQFKNNLREQIINEIVRIYVRVIIDDIHMKITNNSEIDPDKIAANAYDDSIGSNPPNANNIMKYIFDINHYYLEIALNKIEISKETIVTNEIHRLEKIIFDCVEATVKTVKQNDCHNVQQVYQDIVKNLQKILPDFQSSEVMAISAEIKSPDQFKQSFQQLLSDRTKMYEEIVKCKHIFDSASTESCIDLIKTRLGCQARCPGCGGKCDNTEVNHTKHHSSHHLMTAFSGWHMHLTKEPALYLCYQGWLTHLVPIREEKFITTRDYFSEHSPEWFDDLELKSKADGLHNDCKPPLEQRRAWMAVRHALVKRGASQGLKDCKYYDKQLYPDIQSVDADFIPVWNSSVS